MKINVENNVENLLSEHKWHLAKQNEIIGKHGRPQKALRPNKKVRDKFREVID